MWLFLGQLGLGHVLPVESPSIVNSLTGLPVKQIAAGAEHMIILSISGSAFAAGKNNLGQLGVGDNKGMETNLSSLFCHDAMLSS